jgi:hypothetical protein
LLFPSKSLLTEQRTTKKKEQILRKEVAHRGKKSDEPWKLA